MAVDSGEISKNLCAKTLIC